MKKASSPPLTGWNKLTELAVGSMHSTQDSHPHSEKSHGADPDNKATLMTVEVGHCKNAAAHPMTLITELYFQKGLPADQETAPMFPSIGIPKKRALNLIQANVTHIHGKTRLFFRIKINTIELEVRWDNGTRVYFKWARTGCSDYGCLVEVSTDRAWDSYLMPVPSNLLGKMLVTNKRLSRGARMFKKKMGVDINSLLCFDEIIDLVFSDSSLYQSYDLPRVVVSDDKGVLALSS